MLSLLKHCWATTTGHVKYSFTDVVSLFYQASFRRKQGDQKHALVYPAKMCLTGACLWYVDWLQIE